MRLIPSKSIKLNEEKKKKRAHYLRIDRFNCAPRPIQRRRKKNPIAAIIRILLLLFGV